MKVPFMKNVICVQSDRKIFFMSFIRDIGMVEHCTCFMVVWKFYAGFEGWCIQEHQKGRIQTRRQKSVFNFLLNLHKYLCYSSLAKMNAY